MEPELIYRIIIILIGFFVYIIIAASRKAKKLAADSKEGENITSPSLNKFSETNKQEKNNFVDDYYKYGNYEEYDKPDLTAGYESSKQTLFDLYKLESIKKNENIKSINKLPDNQKAKKNKSEPAIDTQEIEINLSEDNIIQAILYKEIFERRGRRKY